MTDFPLAIRRWAILTALATLAAAGCESKQPPPPSVASAIQDLTGRTGNVYEVKYKPSTVVIDRATVLRSLQSVSADDRVFVFDDSEPALHALAPGKVVLLERVALRTVTAVKRDGGHLAVLTEPASLTDAIADGVIKWNIPVRFSELHTAWVDGRGQTDRDWLEVISPALAAESRSLSGEKNGWKYEISAAPGTGRLDLGLKMSKNVNGIQVTLDATGFVPDFNSIAAITIAQGVVSGMDLQNEHLSGEVNMTFIAATTSTPGGFGKVQVRLPAVLKAPFFLGALPLTLEIGSAITFTPGLGANHQLATAKYHLAYNNLTGFSYGGGSSGAKASGASDGNGEILDAKGVTLAGIGIVAGVSMPRLEFKLGTSSIADMIERVLPTGLAAAFEKTFLGDLASKALDVEESIKTEGAAHVQVVLVGSFLASGPVSLIPCDKTTFSFRADAGADASVFGKSIGDVSVDLFQKEIVKTNPPNISCG